MHLPLYFEISLSSNTALGFYLLGVTITIDVHKNIHSIFDGLHNEREWVTNMTNLHHRPHRQFSDKVLVGMSYTHFQHNISPITSVNKARKHTLILFQESYHAVCRKSNVAIN